MTDVEITGEPVFVMNVVGLESWNTTLNKHWGKRRIMTNEFKQLGFDFGMWFKKDWPECIKDLPIIDRCLILIKVMPPRDTEASDIHNVNLKALIDGWRDAKVFVDDEWAYVPLVIFMFGGIHPDGLRMTEVELHELNALVINGVSQVMPMGRIKL